MCVGQDDSTISTNKDLGTKLLLHSNWYRITHHFGPALQARSQGEQKTASSTTLGIRQRPRPLVAAPPTRRRVPAIPSPGGATRPHPRCRNAARWRRPGGPVGTGKTRPRSHGGPAPAASVQHSFPLLSSASLLWPQNLSE